MLRPFLCSHLRSIWQVHAQCSEVAAYRKQGLAIYSRSPIRQNFLRNSIWNFRPSVSLKKPRSACLQGAGPICRSDVSEYAPTSFMTVKSQVSWGPTMTTACRYLYFCWNILKLCWLCYICYICYLLTFSSIVAWASEFKPWLRPRDFVKICWHSIFNHSMSYKVSYDLID